jgi:N-terminal domain of anti-restriction factor ArdC
MKNLTEAKKDEYQAKKAALFNLTVDLIPIAKMEGVKVNDLLIKMYANQLGIKKSDFNTFFTWKEKGYKVKKGEKGFAIWSRPKDVIKEEKTGQQADDQNKYFGLAYLFHVGQVEQMTQETAGTEAN